MQSTIKARLITNPRSGRGGVDLSGSLTILREHGWDVSIRQKLHGGHATELAREAAREGCNVVVDCGGDGTLNELVEGVLGTETAVGVLPGGTANLWAHEVGVASQLQLAALQLVGAQRRRVDVGQVTVNGKHKSHFLLMAGIGLDGVVIDRVNKPLKNRIGPAAVGLAALQSLPSATVVPAQIELDDLHWQGRISEIVVGNTRRYGGFTRVTPDAYADDGLFDVCLMTATGPLSAGRLVGAFLLQQRPSTKDAQYYRAAHVKVTMAMTLPLQVDGGSVKLKDEEPTAEGTLYEFTMLARGVNMLVPRTYNGELFQPASLASVSTNVELQPVPSNNADGSKRKASKSRKRGKHEKQWRMTVLEIGVESLTAARVKNGRVMHIRIDADTTFDDGTGLKRPLLNALSLVSVGDLLEVTGRKEEGDHNALALHIALAGQNGHAKELTEAETLG